VTTRARRTSWTLAEWMAFAGRCRAVRDRLDAMIRDFPETRGLKPAHIRGLIEAHRRFVLAMIPLESDLADQHGEAPGGVGVIALIHGERGTSTWGTCRGRARRDAPPLTRGRWAELGREFVRIDYELWAVGPCLARHLGDGRFCRRTVRAIGAFAGARDRLADLIACQHPDWPHARDVFRGRPGPRSGRGER
jgi:hypothetical protein